MSMVMVLGSFNAGSNLTIVGFAVWVLIGKNFRSIISREYILKQITGSGT